MAMGRRLDQLPGQNKAEFERTKFGPEGGIDSFSFGGRNAIIDSFSFGGEMQ